MVANKVQGDRGVFSLGSRRGSTRISIKAAISVEKAKFGGAGETDRGQTSTFNISKAQNWNTDN